MTSCYVDAENRIGPALNFVFGAQDRRAPVFLKRAERIHSAHALPNGSSAGYGVRAQRRRIADQRELVRDPADIPNIEYCTTSGLSADNVCDATICWTTPGRSEGHTRSACDDGTRSHPRDRGRFSSSRKDIRPTCAIHAEAPDPHVSGAVFRSCREECFLTTEIRRVDGQVRGTLNHQRGTVHGANADDTGGCGVDGEDKVLVHRKGQFPLRQGGRHTHADAAGDKALTEGHDPCLTAEFGRQHRWRRGCHRRRCHRRRRVDAGYGCSGPVRRGSNQRARRKQAGHHDDQEDGTSSRRNPRSHALSPSNQRPRHLEPLWGGGVKGLLIVISARPSVPSNQRNEAGRAARWRICQAMRDRRGGSRPRG